MRSTPLSPPLKFMPEAAHLPKGRVTATRAIWHHYSNTCDSITQIYQRDLFMNEAYVHGFSNLLQQEIIVVDVREKQLAIVCYEPGYGTQEQISMRSACKKREEQVKCLWLLLTQGHFSALLPAV